QGRLIHVDEPFGVSLDFAYDAHGNRTLVQDSFGGTTQSTYDAANQLVSRLFTADGQPTLRIDLGYTTDGQLAQATRYSDAAGTRTYTYDPNGNRTSAGYVTGRDNQLLSDGTFTYTYDAEGNERTKTAIATGDKWTYGYDNLNHLVAAVETAPDGTVEVRAT